MSCVKHCFNLREPELCTVCGDSVPLADVGINHEKLAHPVENCFCDSCCEKRFDSETRTVKTKFNRQAGF